MLACTAMWVGCSNEDVIDNPNENPALNGERAYLKVKLVNTTGSFSRANDTFQEGTADENNVSSVNFFFFKNDGTLTHHADESDLSWHTNTGNVEKIADATVVLRGLNDNTYPNFVMVLLNASDELIDELKESTTSGNVTTFTKKFQDFQEDILQAYKNGEDFIMTNSTFVGDAVESSAHAGTIVTENDFVLESSDDELSDANTVNIYVERLAAKVSVNATASNDMTLTNGVINAKIGEFTIKKIDATTGKETSIKQNLYAKIEKWGLNAIEKNTNLIKKINTSWNFTDDSETTDINESFEWNDAANNRSYWAQSVNYNNSTAKYPASFADASNTSGSNAVTGTDKTDANDATLEYFSYNEMSKTMGGFDYCMENTNTEKCEVFRNNFYSAATQVVLAATIVDDKNSAVEVVRYNRVLYTPEAFIARVLNEVDLEIWKKTSEEVKDESGNVTTKATFAQLSSDDVEEYNVYDGKVKVRAKKEGEIWYTRTAGADTETTEDDTFEEYNGVSLSARLASIFADDIVGEYYKDGMMHYVVPIKHLREGDGIFEMKGNATDAVSIAEAEYGVVRNHLYNLNITSIKNLGTSVYDASEDIIKTTVDETTYLIAAQLNILSWKIVSQEVKL